MLADSSKFMRRGFSKIADISEVDLIITDEGVPEAMRQKLEERGIELIIAR